VADDTGLSSPVGLAIDGPGNFYISDAGNRRVVELPANGGSPIVITPVAQGYPLMDIAGLAVDTAGDLFIAEPEFQQVVEVFAQYDQPAFCCIWAWQQPQSLAIDAAGDIFAGNVAGPDRLLEYFAAAVNTVDLTPDSFDGQYIGQPSGLSLDGAGDLFAADPQDNRVYELRRSQPPTISFPTPTTLGTTDTTDGPVTTALENVGTTDLLVPGPISGSNPAISSNFTLSSGEDGTCPSATYHTGLYGLVPGDSCLLSISFTPRALGSLNGSLVVTDNSLNASAPGYVSQTIQLTGTGKANAAGLTSPTPGSQLSGSTETFTWYPATGGTIYAFNLGSTGPGSFDLYNSGHISGTSVVASGLPTDNSTIYATLWTYIPNSGSPWVINDYTFRAANKPVALVSPAPGSTLTGSTVTFSWAPGNGSSTYALDLGSTGPGTNNLYNSGHIAATSVTVSGLPTNGETIYAQLWSYIANSGSPWSITNYTYTAAP
jgi:hypothetical protein